MNCSTFHKNIFNLQPMKKIIIAIDGLSATGKSTLAKQLAKKLNYTYIDSGAMYRAITYDFIQKNIDTNNTAEIEKALRQIQLKFLNNIIYLNDMPLDEEIRSMKVSQRVSDVAAIDKVRIFAVTQQKEMGLQRAIVMDGRDIGTTVFPDAELKIYLFANEEIRVQRRFLELKQKDSLISIEEIRKNLRYRDEIDTTRAISPLKKAEDAIELDNSHLSMDEQLDIAYKMAMDIINS